MSRLALVLAPLALVATPGLAQATDPHAGHAPAPAAAAPAQPDPHAAHRAKPAAPVPAPAADPHAGHAPQAAPAATPVDPHAAHRAPAPTPAQAADPHAGHGAAAPAASTQPDPHAGHAMAVAASTPDVPTSADNPGRPPEAPPPPAAFSGPRHAADLFYGSEEQAAARRQLRREHGDLRTTAVVVDRLEAGFGEDETYLWDVQGWSGGDINRFWWKTEGEGVFGSDPEAAEVQALYSRAILPFWDLQAGVRRDFRSGSDDTTHLVLGLQGLAPYWFEVDAATFLSTDGDLTARVEAEYDQRITQRLILQPRVEVEFAAQDVPELNVGSGLGRLEAGFRLRYEFRKEFAPYVGVEWGRAFGRTRDLVEAHGEDADATRFVVGLRAWF
jgi:copper resistance protein B